MRDKEENTIDLAQNEDKNSKSEIGPLSQNQLEKCICSHIDPPAETLANLIQLD